MLWHDRQHNLKIWLEYFLGVILKAYKELEERVGHVANIKGGKSGRIEKAIEGKIESVGKGRSAKWKKIF